VTQIGAVRKSLGLDNYSEALRTDPVLARRYQELKERLAADSCDIAAYTAGKREFVVHVLAKAGVIAEQWQQAGRR
jgi:ABC-type phosphate/phosphonate transport system substrate-binding protein